MRIGRALLLSSKQQAEAWEKTAPGIGSLGFVLRPAVTQYRFLVSRTDGVLCLAIFRIHQEKDGNGHVCDVAEDEPHVSIDFADMGRLLNFLHRYQIDAEAWQPVEEARNADTAST